MKRTKPEKRSLIGMLLRLFKSGRSFQESVSLQERDAHVGITRGIYYDYQKEIRTALLEAERKKAEAIEWHRRKIIC